MSFYPVPPHPSAFMTVYNPFGVFCLIVLFLVVMLALIEDFE
jgi:hypothetical protein